MSERASVRSTIDLDGTSPQFFTIPDYIFKGGQLDTRIAIEGIDGRTITYRGLRENVRTIVNGLNSLGFKKNDRIAIVFYDGVEMAVTSVAIPSGFIAIPLSPQLKPSELTSYLVDIGAKAVIMDNRYEGALKGTTKACGIEVVEILSPKEKKDGVFTISGHLNSSIEDNKYAAPEDVAFIMQTSGTTAKPKWIPRTHSNVCWAMFIQNKFLGPAAEDKGIIAAPLFHGQGLFVLYSSLFAGSTAVCASFNPAEFYHWLDSLKPTWYIGGSTIHQWVLDAAEGNEDLISRIKLKVIRTGAGSTPQKTLQGLEKLFGAHAVETYAMTETGTIAWNPNPSQNKKFNLCYRFGSEVQIVGEKGQTLERGNRGEISVCGPAVSKNYENNPAATSSAFINGWFRTGDLGYIDQENCLHIEGRFKEVINRGGEKIAPQEVEDVLQEHPAIAEAVVFPVPHPRMGEDVAAAVVLKKEFKISEKDLRMYLFNHLTYFKVPTRITFVEYIPKEPAGKMNRLDMAKKLGIC